MLRHKYNTLCILILLLLCVAAKGRAQFFKHLDMKSGLSNLSVLSVSQDTLGRMWFGTNDGLNRYDGKRMVVYRTYDVGDEPNRQTKLISGAILRLARDVEGDILLFDDQALLKYDVRRERLYQLYAGSVSSLTRIGDDVFFTASDSLFRIAPATEKPVSVRKLNLPTVYCMTRKDGHLYYGTKRGLYRQDGKEMHAVLPGVEIFQLFVSSRNELWIGSRMEGLYRVTPDGKLQKERQAPDRVVSPQIREFTEDESGNIWFGTFNGLQKYNPQTDTYSVYRPSDNPGSLTHESVFPLYRDRTGTIWAGTYYGGVNHFNLKNDIFRYYAYNPYRPDGLNFPVVNGMIEDAQGRIWIGTDGGGINVLNPGTGEFTHFRSGDGSGLQQNNIKSISCDDRCEQVYIGTYTGGLFRCDARTGRFYSYMAQSPENNPGSVIHHTQYHNGYLYVSSRSGFWRLDTATGEFRQLYRGKNFLTFCIDNRNNAWLASYPCLYRMKLDGANNTSGKLPMERMLKTQVQITRIVQTKDGRLYLSTLGNGLMAYAENTQKWTPVTAEHDNLISDFCYNMTETAGGNLLVTTNSGFSVYSPYSGAVYSYWFDARNGVSGVTYGNGLLSASSGILYIGGVDGLISFREKDLIKGVDSTAKLYFCDVYVNNERITPTSNPEMLPQTLPFVHELHLKYNQNNVSIEFANSDYSGRGHNLTFQYKLEGFNRDWITTEQTTLDYTNLSPGRYVLKVREAKNRPADADSHEITLTLVIDRPPYASWWALLGYALVVGALVYFWQRLRRKRKQLAESLEKEKTEKEKIEELNKVKLRFFTNVSHEFRTPLTLIVGQTELLLQKDDLPSGIATKLHSIYRNAMNLRILITELLDFRKQEQGFMTLKVQQVDLIPFLEKVYQSFSEAAHSRDIMFRLEYIERDIRLWIDPIQMQRVMFNLLSNAFKFTKDGGRIKISVRQTAHSVDISVSDNGCGIPRDAQSKIFTRFFQVEGSQSASGMGSGIGLAFTKAIVEAHKGIVSVESAEGQGSDFRISLRKGNAHFTSAELEHEAVDISAPEWKDPYEETAHTPAETETETNEPKAHTVLVIDDEKEIRDMLRDALSPYYNVCTADNGKDGFDMARQIHPDLVISDVIMPVMSGKKLCYKIKNCIELAYVPVILLTAQASDDYAIEGFMFGADDYIAKPFNLKMLLVRCENLIKSRRLMLNQARQDTAAPSVSSTLNAKIQEKAVEIIRQNFSNPDFGMKELAQALNMGRTKMFATIKEVTGLTPNELTLKLKLEEAFRILQTEPEYNVSEISYRLGFNSPQYFSRCFKSFYGVSPQNYRKNGNQTGQNCPSDKPADSEKV